MTHSQEKMTKNNKEHCRILKNVELFSNIKNPPKIKALTLDRITTILACFTCFCSDIPDAKFTFTQSNFIKERKEHGKILKSVEPFYDVKFAITSLQNPCR